MSRQQRFILDASLLGLLLLVFAAGFVQSPALLDGWHKFSFLWYMLSAFAGLFLMSLALRQSGWPFFSWRDSWFWMSAFVFLPAALLRLSYTWDISVWLDEYVQVANLQAPFKEAAVQQQPPFYYLLSAAVIQIFGWTEAWLRSPSLVFGSASIFIGALLGRIAGFSKWVYLLWLLFLAFTPILIRYSFEGRPNILGVFVCLLWMCSLAPPVIRGSLEKWDFVRLVLSTYLFCLTIGLQSLALPLYSFPILLLAATDKTSRQTYRRVISAQLLALLAFSPILYGIVMESIAIDQFQANWGERLLMLSNLEWFENAIRVFEMVPFLFTLLHAAFFAFIFTYHRKHRRWRPMLLTFIFLLALPFVFTGIFQIAINWEFYERYFLCFPVIFIFLILAVVDTTRDLMPNWRPGTITILVSAALLSVALTWKVKQDLFISRMFNYGSDFRKMYDYVNGNHGYKNLISMFSVFSEGTFEPRALVAPEFYLDKSQNGKFLYRRHSDGGGYEGDQVLAIVKSLFSENVSDLFLVMGPFSLVDNQHFPDHSSPAILNVQRMKNYELIHFRKRDQPLHRELELYVEAWLQSSPPESYRFKLREVLFYISVFSGRMDRARAIYKELRKEHDPEGTSPLKRFKLTLMEKVLSGQEFVD